MTTREPAWRVFAAELWASRVDERGAGERAPSFLLSPFGARVSRAIVAGTVEPPEGAAGSAAFVRARFRDPTGELVLTAGAFQPEGSIALQRVDAPASALVVGKAHWSRDGHGTPTPGLRVEGLRMLSEDELRFEHARTVQQAIDRLRLRRSAVASGRGPKVPTDASPPRRWVDAARAAATHYPEPDYAEYQRQLARVLDFLEGRTLPSPAPNLSPPPAPSAATVTRSAPRPDGADRTDPSAAERAEESAFLDDIDELCEASIDGYAELKEVLARCGRRGVSAPRAEEILNRLEESGVLEEPLVGRLRRA